MAFTDSLFKSILQKAIEIEKWAILERGTKPLRKELNFYDILDELRNDGKDGYAKELEKTRDELLGEVEKPPTFTSSQTAFGLFKKLRRIIEDRTDDGKKLLLYADSIEDLIKDDTKLYPQIWRGEFEKLLDIVVSHIQGYDLFGELLSRIKEKDPTAATQLKEKYDQLIILSNVENAREDELKAVKSAAFDLVSLMREIAETRQEIETQGKDDQSENWHNDDFTEVFWNGKKYKFNKQQQAFSVEYLWKNKRAREKSIGEAIGSEADNFRLIHIFRQKNAKMHPAWGTMIVPDGRGIYALAECKKVPKK